MNIFFLFKLLKYTFWSETSKFKIVIHADAWVNME